MRSHTAESVFTAPCSVLLRIARTRSARAPGKSPVRMRISASLPPTWEISPHAPSRAASDSDSVRAAIAVS